ncbi:MAG: WcaI family glycosyltransferase [Cytophagaceae bacterium]
MRILIYGINYSPELTGIGKYTGEMGEWLALRGHDVNVITSMPYYPEWKIHKSYQGKWWHREIISKAKVYRSPFYVPEKVTGKSRIIHEFSFMLSTFLWGIRFLFAKRADVLIAIYPPLVIGFLPLIYSFFHKTKVIIHIQDLQVDAARELGLIKNQRLLNVLERLEKYFLTGADHVSSISEGMKRRIIEKGVQESRYIMFPNWVDTDFIKPLPKSESLRAELGIAQDDKVFLYSGNIGEKQGIEILVPIAEKFKTIPEVKIFIAGEGAGKVRLETEIRKRNLTNIILLPLQPYHKLASFLAIADVHLVLQKKAASDLVLPSKFVSIISSGGYSIVTATVGTTLYEISYHNNLASVIEPENESALYNEMKKVLHADLTEIKQNARRYAEDHFSRDAVLRKFEEEVLSR